MATVPAWPTLGVGHILTNADMAAIKAVTDFMMNGVGGVFVGVQATIQSIANATDVALLWDTEEMDTDSGHSTITNTSRYTVQTAGKYRVSGVASYAASAGGTYRIAKIRVNGATVKAVTPFVTPIAGVVTDVPVGPRILQLAVGDYVELIANQNSGGALNSNIAADGASWMCVDRICA